MCHRNIGMKVSDDDNLVEESPVLVVWMKNIQMMNSWRV